MTQEDWQSLAFEMGRIRANRPRSARGSGPSTADASFWNALFAFSHRRLGVQGAFLIWKELSQRRCLCHVQREEEATLWREVLHVAVADEVFLRSAWEYAEWMRSASNALWPDFYNTVISHCLDRGQPERAIRWHVRLMQHFDPGRPAFIEILSRFIDNTEPNISRSLQTIYALSHHRRLYDTIMSMLWARECPTLATEWHAMLILHDDLPTSDKTHFVHNHDICSKSFNLLPRYPAATPMQLPTTAESLALITAETSSALIQLHSPESHLFQRTWSDVFGARWFASSWMKFGVAVRIAFTMGIREIGPLSIQSIALAAGDPQSLLERFDLLDELQIRVTSSNYVSAVRHFAKTNDAPNLDRLLQCDLHPDIFDNDAEQIRILEATARHGDWNLHQIIVSVRRITQARALRIACDNFVASSVSKQDNKPKLIRVLGEMTARGVKMSPMTANRIIEATEALFDESRWGLDPDYFAALFRQMAATGQFVTADLWRKLILLYGDLYRFDDLEAMSLEVVRLYRNWQSFDTAPRTTQSREPHNRASPGMTQKSHLPVGESPFGRDPNPLELIFDDTFTTLLITQALRGEVPSERDDVEDSERRFRLPIVGLGRALSLLRMLIDRGVEVDPHKVRRVIMTCLCALYPVETGAAVQYGPIYKYPISQNHLSLKEAKQRLNSAWRGEIFTSGEITHIWETDEDALDLIARDRGTS
jgi:hypothetical protein